MDPTTQEVAIKRNLIGDTQPISVGSNEAFAASITATGGSTASRAAVLTAGRFSINYRGAGSLTGVTGVTVLQLTTRYTGTTNFTSPATINSQVILNLIPFAGGGGSATGQVTETTSVKFSAPTLDSLTMVNYHDALFATNSAAASGLKTHLNIFPISGGATNYAILLNSNTANSGSGICAGTSGDTCLWRASTGVWGFNTGTSLQMDGGSASNVAVIATGGNLRLGSAVGTAKATTDTTGWPMMPSVAGTPTGVPQNESANSAVFTYDRTGKKLWIRDQPTNSWLQINTGATSAGVSSLAGTTNQITASASTGAVTLSIPATFKPPGSIASTTTLGAGTVQIGTGTRPTLAYGSGANCGSSASTFTFAGTNQFMELAFATGSGSCGVNAPIATLTFGATAGISTRFMCNVQRAESNSVLIQFFVTGTATSFSLMSGPSGLTASTSYSFFIGPCGGY